MKTILIATDFSPAASNAANYAADMAIAVNADLLLLHVFQVPVIYLEVPLAATDADMREAAETQLADLKKKLSRKAAGKLSIETEVSMGDFFTELSHVCERIKPYTVVMGSQGKTAMERLFFGGHSIFAMKYLPWPLITVPAGVSFSSVKRIGVACDFEDVMDKINIDEIKTLVEDFNADLYILNTAKKGDFDPEIVFESGVLEDKLAPVKAHFNFITSTDTDEGIIDFVNKNNIDLLVVLPKRHSLLEKLIHRSHTKQLVMHSHIPVMAIHH